jgi:ABC-type Fe3+-hydroxamate transport system substrate-binding protein
VSVTYKSAPKRAVTNDINTTEDMLALGLEPHMVGTFAAVGDGPADAPAIPAVYQAGFKKVRDAPSYLSKFGIKMLVVAESCAHVQSGTSSVSINETYQDLRNLGEIFNVRARAQQVISGMQAEVAAARAKIAGLKPVKVFDYDSGQSAPVTGPGLSMPTALISLGGGTNIFGSLKQSWTSVSWEQVVAAQPQHHHQRLQHPDGRPEGEVPGDLQRQQEPRCGEEPLLPAAELRRGHPQPPQCRGRRGHRPVAASVGIRPARRRLLTPARRRQPLAGTVSG